MTAAELFPLLTPTADNYFGAYALFQMTLPDTLKTADLLLALGWATQLIAQSDRMGGFRGDEFGGRHHVQGMAIVGEPRAEAVLPRTFAVRLRHYGDLCRGTDHELKKPSLLHCATMLRDGASSCSLFVSAAWTGSRSIPTGARACSSKLTYSGSFPSRRADQIRHWALTLKPCAISSSARSSSITSLISRRSTLPPSGGLRCARDMPCGLTGFAWIYRALRKPASSREQLRALENDLPPPIAPDPASQILSRLGEAEAGRWQAWWQLTHYLMLTPEEPSFRGRARIISSRRCRDGARQTSASAPHRRRRRTIPGRSRDQRRRLAGAYPDAHLSERRRRSARLHSSPAGVTRGLRLALRTTLGGNGRR